MDEDKQQQQLSQQEVSEGQMENEEIQSRSFLCVPIH
jgi:hypothetical protein